MEFAAGSPMDVLCMPFGQHRVENPPTRIVSHYKNYEMIQFHDHLHLRRKPMNPRQILPLLLITILLTACTTPTTPPTATALPTTAASETPTKTTLPTATQTPLPTATKTPQPTPTATEESASEIMQPTQTVEELLSPDARRRDEFLEQMEVQFDNGGLPVEDGIYHLKCVAAADMVRFPEPIERGDDIFTHGIPCQYPNPEGGADLIAFIPTIRFNLIEGVYQILAHDPVEPAQLDKAMEAFTDQIKGPLNFLNNYTGKGHPLSVYFANVVGGKPAAIARDTQEQIQTNTYLASFAEDGDPAKLWEQLLFPREEIFISSYAPKAED